MLKIKTFFQIHRLDLSQALFIGSAQFDHLIVARRLSANQTQSRRNICRCKDQTQDGVAFHHARPGASHGGDIEFSLHNQNDLNVIRIL